MSAVLLDEGEHATPGVVAGVLPLLECAVEEAVGRSLVDVHLQRHARGGQLALELFGDLHGGRSVGASHQQQQWSLHPRDVWLASRRSPIEADAAVEAPVQRGLVPRTRATKAEAHREQRTHRSAVFRFEIFDRRGDVYRDVFLCGLLEMGHVFEALTAAAPPAWA